MSDWRPSPDEERWLEVASDLGAAVPRAAVAERTGGWRNTGPLARVALFVLGLVAAALLFGILGMGSKATLLVAGLSAALAAEWLTVEKRLHASGIEEGLCVAGFLLIGAWITTLFEGGPRFAGGSVDTLVLIAAVAAAGLRLLNPLVTTGAVLAFVDWAGSTATAGALDQAIGGGLTGLTLGVVLAALALALGAREYRRPSHDRMLDWLVATLPIAAYAQHANWSIYTLMHFQVAPVRAGWLRRCCCWRSVPRCWSLACAGDDMRRCWASWAASPASRWSCASPPRSPRRPGSSFTGSPQWSREWHWTVTCDNRATA